jgi:hypothetical protein
MMTLGLMTLLIATLSKTAFSIEECFFSVVTFCYIANCCYDGCYYTECRGVIEAILYTYIWVNSLDLFEYFFPELVL